MMQIRDDEHMCTSTGEDSNSMFIPGVSNFGLGTGYKPEISGSEKL